VCIKHPEPEADHSSYSAKVGNVYKVTRLSPMFSWHCS